MLYTIFQAICITTIILLSELYQGPFAEYWFKDLCSSRTGTVSEAYLLNQQAKRPDSKQFYLSIQSHSPLVFEKNISEACIYYTHVDKINAKVTSIFKWLLKPLHNNSGMTRPWEVPDGVLGSKGTENPCRVSVYRCV